MDPDRETVDAASRHRELRMVGMIERCRIRVVLDGVGEAPEPILITPRSKNMNGTVGIARASRSASAWSYDRRYLCTAFLESEYDSTPCSSTRYSPRSNAPLTVGGSRPASCPIDDWTYRASSVHYQPSR